MGKIKKFIVKSKNSSESNEILSGAKSKRNVKKRCTKKERQSNKKVKIVQRINATQTAFIEEKAREKREKTEIIKDVKPLLDALPSMDSIFYYKNEKFRTGVLAYDKPQGKKQEKQQRREKLAFDFQEKLCKHKNLVQTFSLLTATERKEMIRHRMSLRQNNQHDMKTQ